MPGELLGAEVPGSFLVVMAVAVAAGVAIRARKRRQQVGKRRRRRAFLVVAALTFGVLVLGQPAAAQPFDCREPPEPDRPGTGLVGTLDPPTFGGVGEPGSVYSEVGFAGMVWHNYDLGCIGTAVLNPATTTDTWLGNQAFNFAKLVVAVVNWAHYLIADGGELLRPIDDIVSNATQTMYDTVFTTWIGPVLVVLAVLLLVLALRGDLARQAQRAAYAIVALVIGSAAYLAPIDWAKAADELLLDGVTQMQEGFLGEVGLGGRDTLPTVLVDQVVYRNWLRGEFGSPDVPKAQELGRDLLRAQTFTKAEVVLGQDTPELAEQKKADFAALAERMGDRYAYFQGKAGSRIGAGTLAVVQAVCIALFQMLSKILVLVAMLLLRLMVMTAPAIAVVAVLKTDILPALLRVGGAAIVNTLVVGALAGLHALLVVALFGPNSGVDLWLALLITGVVTLVFWAVARPFRRLVTMVSLTREQFGSIVPSVGSGPVARIWSRIRGSSPADDRQSRWWAERRAAGADAPPEYGDRPEAEPVIVVRPPQRPTSPPRPQLVSGDQTVVSVGPRRPALLSGSGAIDSRDIAGWDDVGDIDDRVIYRRSDDVPLRPGGIRPVSAEIVDGVPVYRIYRPPRRRPTESTGSPRTWGGVT